jgi:ATP-dependent RNA/DNA helicase IGHMBP2
MNNRKFFDVAILDEAAQSMKVSSWIPILMAEKVIMAGDHKQLPPTVKSKVAQDRGLGVTLFKEISDICDKKCKKYC